MRIPPQFDSRGGACLAEELVFLPSRSNDQTTQLRQTLLSQSPSFVLEQADSQRSCTQSALSPLRIPITHFNSSCDKDVSQQWNCRSSPSSKRATEKFNCIDHKLKAARRHDSVLSTQPCVTHLFPSSQFPEARVRRDSTGVDAQLYHRSGY